MDLTFFCGDGSPIGIIPKDLYERGVGGAELALISLAEEFVRRGHDVTIFNNPRERVDGPIRFASHQEFWDSGESADVFVLFRSPHRALHKSQAPTKIFWSCDQATVGHYGRDIFPFVDHIITISPFHAAYFRERWNCPEEKLRVIDLGVRLQDYNRIVPKVPGRMIFTSVPDRGLEILAHCWEEIKSRVPHAELFITGDYRLWGTKNPGTHPFRMRFAGMEGVHYLGAIPRKQLVELQLSSDLLIYPCIYPELFCIAAAEAQVAGALPITSQTGALLTTNLGGQTISGSPLSQPWRTAFIERIVETMEIDRTELEKTQDLCSVESRKRFDWSRIAKSWEELH